MRKTSDVSRLTSAKRALELLADRTNVAEPLSEVAERMFERTRELKESLAIQAVRHGLTRFMANRNTYTEVMGRPVAFAYTEAMIGRALLDPKYKRALLEDAT